MIDHGRIIHAIDMIAGQDQHLFGTASLEHIEVLINRIRAAAIPTLAHAHLWRYRGDVFAKFRIEQRPAVAQMLLQ